MEYTLNIYSNQPIKNTPYIFLKNFFDFLKKEANMA